MASREHMSTKKRRNTKHGKSWTTPLIMIIVMVLRWCSVSRWKERYSFLRHLRLQIDSRRSSPNSAHSSYHPYYWNCLWSNGPDLLTGYWRMCQYTNITCQVSDLLVDNVKKYFARLPCYFSSTPLQITSILTYVNISSCLHRASTVSKHFLLFQLMHTIVKIIQC